LPPLGVAKYVSGNLCHAEHYRDSVDAA
jgi:hypothetical protein